MSEQQPKADSVSATDVASDEASEAPTHTDNLANPFGLLKHQFTVPADAAWTSEQRQAIQKDLFIRAQVMRERLYALLEQLRAERRANEAMNRAEEMSHTVRYRITAAGVQENGSPMAELLAGTVRESGTQFLPQDDESKND